jgi:hypothetical protein
MRLGQISFFASALLIASALPAVAGPPHVRRGPTSPHTSKKVKATGQTTIEPERATQIQTALIKARYMSGTPSGTWDANTQAAMAKLQADNGWPTKIVPDARAIIKLGLGPSADSAAMQASTRTGEETETPAAGEEQNPSTSVISSH